MKKYTKETFKEEAEKARVRFQENYDSKDILDMGNWETEQYCDYFMQEFHSGSVVGFSNWEHEDYFCTWYSDALKKIVMIDSDAYLNLENWESFIDSLWKYQEEAQELEERLKNIGNEDIEMLQRENKAMAIALLKLGYTNEQISDIANGAI